MYLAGQITGAFLMIFLLAALLEWALFKRVMASRRVAALISTAVVTFAIVMIFVLAFGDLWFPTSDIILTLIGGALVAGVQLLKYRNKYQPQTEVIK